MAMPRVVRLCLTPRAALGMAMPPRVVRLLNVSPSERAALSEALEEVTGEQWLVRASEPPAESPHARLAELRGCAPIDAQNTAELLDESLEEPLLLVALPEEEADGEGDSDPAMSTARVERLVEAHERTWGLRQQVGAAEGSAWTPASATLAARVLLDGAAREGAAGFAGLQSDPAWDASSDPEWDVSELSVWDGLVDEPLRAALLALLQEEGAPEEAGPSAALWTRQLVDRNDAPDGGLPSWTLRAEAVRALCPAALKPRGGSAAPHDRPAAVLEFEGRLRALLAHCDVCFAPPPFAALPVLPGGDDDDDDDEDDDDDDDDGSVELDGSLTGSTPIVANAPQAGESFTWHIDGDPLQAAPSPWTDLHSYYPNRSPAKPRLVSALVYLNSRWDAAWGAPTKFVDPPTGAEVWVQPSPGRVILLDQDVTHSVSAPEPAAGPERPRYSLVWKLALHLPGPTPPPACAAGAADSADACGAVVRLTPEAAARQAREARREHIVGSASWRGGRQGSGPELGDEPAASVLVVPSPA